jgi:hypothetical protein
MPLSVFELYVPGSNFVMQYYGSRTKAVEDQAIACETCSESDSDSGSEGTTKNCGHTVKVKVAPRVVTKLPCGL